MGGRRGGAEDAALPRAAAKGGAEARVEEARGGARAPGGGVDADVGAEVHAEDVAPAPRVVEEVGVEARRDDGEAQRRGEDELAQAIVGDGARVLGGGLHLGAVGGAEAGHEGVARAQARREARAEVPVAQHLVAVEPHVPAVAAQGAREAHDGARRVGVGVGEEDSPAHVSCFPSPPVGFSVSVGGRGSRRGFASSSLEGMHT